MRRTEILTLTKSCHSVTNIEKMTHYNPNLYLAIVNAKFGRILSILHSQGIERKEILTSTNHAMVETLNQICKKMVHKIPNFILSFMCIQNLVEFCPFNFKILSRNNIFTSDKGSNSFTFSKIVLQSQPRLSQCECVFKIWSNSAHFSQDIERKQKI